MEIVFKFAGTKKIETLALERYIQGVVEMITFGDILVLKLEKGRPKLVVPRWLLFDDNSITKDTDGEPLFKFSEPTRKEILGSSYGMRYLTDESWKLLFVEVRRLGIPVRMSTVQEDNHYGKILQSKFNKEE